MNRFAIIYLTALFCVSLAQPQEYRKVHCQISEAIVHNRIKRNSQTFDNGKVYLYENIDDENDSVTLYHIEDDSGEFSRKFTIAQHRTVVTDDGITILFCSLTILIFTLDEDNVAFYQDLFSLGDFDHEFPVTKVVRGGETLENVLVVNSKENEDSEWIFAAVDSSGAPRLIFPRRYVKWTEEYEDGDKDVSFYIEHEMYGKKITVEFDKWTAAKTFYAFINSRKIPYQSFGYYY